MIVPPRRPAARIHAALARFFRPTRILCLLAGVLVLAACAPVSLPVRSSFADPDPILAENSDLLAEQNLPGSERYQVTPPRELPGPLPGRVPLAPPGRPGNLRLPGLAEAPPRATDIPEFPTLDDLEVEARLERLAKLPPSLGLDLVRTGLTQKGRRYRRAGTSPVTGFDCSGFTQWTFRQHGLSLPRTAQEQYNTGIRIGTSELRAGDLVFYKINRRGRWHVGIYMDDDVFVHSPRPGRGISEANMKDGYWAKRYLGARRYTR
ncbi:MAG: C40 family peptidase [Humidesulfovibrio sp.]|uniref:C40 family peptidase n=1 Tax=Humidesulfovibrio sp. TaxID=2910988 RepID=UPI0027360275|nr:C40 family peptidase [Humidesulfovibrio sp.]MDP2848840.1 C40 family peptidase [Humidesulfovibrio sp.]